MKEKIGEMSWSLEEIKECHYGAWLVHETGKASAEQSHSKYELQNCSSTFM